MRYTVSWTDPNRHLYDISIAFTAPSDDPVLHLPVWRPGRYLIQNFAANVREWSPNMTKIAKSSWRVAARAGEEVTVSYRYFAGVLDAGSSFLDDEEAYFNGSNFFMWLDALRHERATVTIAAPADWLIETQLPRDDDAPNTFVARDYDHLIDSPFVCSATLIRHSFVESGARFHLVFRGAEGIDVEQYVEPMRAIVRAQAAMFGALPFREYRFLYHVGTIWHGVEHEDSSSIIVRRSALLGAQPHDEGWDHFLSISAHELFHAWNVKRVLPRAFAPYDYTRETPTRLLWAMEGITSYFGELSLVRAGLWSEARYFEHLEKEIETLESAPGREFVSLAQASFDGWLQEPAQMHDKANAWISFYNKGELVAALLDLAIRARTTKTLDDVMLHLWQERTLDEDAIERAVEAVTGEDFRDFFAKYVDGVEPLPYEELLAAAGVGVETSEGGVSFGAKFRRVEGRLIVDTVIAAGPFAEAGILPGDELVATGGVRAISEADVAPFLRDGEAVEVLLARGGVMRQRTVTPRTLGRRITLRIDEPTALRTQWLRRNDD